MKKVATIYRDENVNFISVILSWSSVLVFGFTQYLVRYSIQDCLIFFAIGCMYIVPTFLYIRNKHDKFIKYFMIFGTMIYIYILLFLQNGLFDNTYYLLITIGITAIYFDIRLTIYSILINMLCSTILYFKYKTLFFPIFRIDNFITLELAFILIGIIISLQTYWSKKLLQSYECIYEKAIRDKLTNLYNRTYFDEFFIESVERFKLQKNKLSVIVLDIDNFKKINDTFGHAKGDLVLQGISDCISSVCRSNDVAARIGGEEFIILLLDTTKEVASIIAEDLRKMIEENQINNISVTVSLGVTSLNDSDTTEDVFDRADKALYMAKNKGKNCSVVL